MGYTRQGTARAKVRGSMLLGGVEGGPAWPQNRECLAAARARPSLGTLGTQAGGLWVFQVNWSLPPSLLNNHGSLRSMAEPRMVVVRGADIVQQPLASASENGGPQARDEFTARVGVPMQGVQGSSLGSPSGHSPVAMAPGCH